MREFRLKTSPCVKPSDPTWITKKLQLYGKWRRIIEGADGIEIVYDAGEGSDPPTDTIKYLDQAIAVAGHGSTPPSVGAGETPLVFKYWTVMRWNGSALVDTNEHINAFDNFTVQLDYTHVTNLDPPVGTTTKKYTLTLKAVYGYEESADHTSITYNGNGGTVNTQAFPQDLKQ